MRIPPTNPLLLFGVYFEAHRVSKRVLDSSSLSCLHSHLFQNTNLFFTEPLNSWGSVVQQSKPNNCTDIAALRKTSSYIVSKLNTVWKVVQIKVTGFNEIFSPIVYRFYSMPYPNNELCTWFSIHISFNVSILDTEAFCSNLCIHDNQLITAIWHMAACYNTLTGVKLCTSGPIMTMIIKWWSAHRCRSAA